MGCTGSKPEPPKQDATVIATPAVSESKLKVLPSGGFAKDGSPMFQEYLKLLGDIGDPAAVGPITADDALLVIDMQQDFCPVSPTNPNGGRFGVPEGENIVPLTHPFVISPYKS